MSPDHIGHRHLSGDKLHITYSSISEMQLTVGPVGPRGQNFRGCFFPDLDPSVNLIGHAAITEMIKLQFTTITDRIRNKIRNGNWFPKFSINRKEQKFLPICLRLLTLLTIIKDPSLK
jgi:hypothetical protein